MADKEKGNDEKDYEKTLSSEGSKGGNSIMDHWFIHLFFGRKFFLHRIVGLIFLIQWTLAIVLYLFMYDVFLHSPLVWTVPITGLIQSIIAAYTFTFMPRKIDPGITFLSDKSALSYFFIIENSFFEMLLAFQWLYYSDTLYPYMQYLIFPELIYVFFPYAIRPLWPKTRFRDALQNTKNKSDSNRTFMIVSTWIIKVFYIFAKHYIGYFLNYVRFLNTITPDEQYQVYGLMITSSFATTISIFLHTLKFKGYIGPKTATIVYEVSYIVTGYYFLRMFSVFAANPEIALLTFAGLLINFSSIYIQQFWQAIMCGLLYSVRFGYLSLY